MNPLHTCRKAEGFAERVLKVNHAGEHGAVNIYAGQLLVARLIARDLIPELTEFQSHERRHRSIFESELLRRGVRRCRSFHLCGIGGFALGFISALLGRSAIAVTTVAVERVMLRHLEHQLKELHPTDEAAARAVMAIVDDEQQHHDLSAAHVRKGRLLDRILSPVVEASTETVIWLGMRL
ncbi:demethoxyubiquinone hydroxylase family protein [Hydrogenophaga sp. 5NK40-0174]|uniref:demethoxyubiquinone hydroxylase family protein n=1 Tax=Hydrogenophaga sp. 5NK40-0174 TaxID=3127649 RepID=UPI00333F5454